MLLDFFATFFSSATALLPIYAQDILGVGANGYGWLYAAPAAGAIVTSAVMVRAVEVINRRGHVLTAAVMGYGLATVLFGLSRNFWLSFACLAATGATDTVSMVFRNLIRQMTPDHLRGRMVGVNMIFSWAARSSASWRRGWWRTGRPVASVVSGGIGAWSPPAGSRRRRRLSSLTAAKGPRPVADIEGPDHVRESGEPEGRGWGGGGVGVEVGGWGRAGGDWAGLTPPMPAPSP